MPKEEVLAWKPGDSFTRKAFVITLSNRQTAETIVDLTGAKARGLPYTVHGLA